MKNIKDYDLPALKEEFVQMGERPFRAEQVFKWLYEVKVTNFDEMTNLSLELREKLKQDMGEKFIVTKGLDGCLFAFSQNEWLNFETKLKALPLSDRNARNFVRFFLSGATECEIDKQGRFLIPSNLRTAAGLEKEAVIIGVGTRLEIWNKATWEKCDENISADEIAENMTMLGI